MEEAGVLSDEKIEVPDPYYGDMSDFEKGVSNVRSNL